MKNLKREVLWGTLVLIILLTVFSVYGAFLGAARAKVFFNSIPLAVYWTLFLALLVVGCLLFRRLVRIPALLLIHAGCIAILIGGLWGSDKGQQIQRRLLGRDIVRSGYVMLYGGQQTNQVQVGKGNDTHMETLPFIVAVDDFRIEYYEPGKLFIGIPGTQNQWSMPAEPNTQLDLGPKFGSVRVVRSFKNFRISMGETGTRGAYDDPGPGANAAVEIQVTPPGNGPPTPRYIFEQHPGHANPNSPLAFQYRRTIRDYISDVRILAKQGDPNAVARKAVEVNHPIYYGGYHFYQSSYGQDPGTGLMYTVLSVTSSNGLMWVFSGFLLMCLGIAWQCWFLDIRKVLAQEAL